MSVPAMYPLEVEQRSEYGDADALAGSSALRAVPPIIAHKDLWHEAAAKVVDVAGLTYDSWGGKDFAACHAIYKNKCRKRGIIPYHGQRL